MSIFRMSGEEFTIQIINPDFNLSHKEHEQKRDEIASQVDRFLEQGGAIQEVPFGVSSMTNKPISKQFRI